MSAVILIDDDYSQASVFEEELKYYSGIYEPKSKDNVYELVGVEYVVKILSESIVDRSKYECAMCEVFMDALYIQNHLIVYKYRLKFCEKHF